jgi:hypothetical protein
VEIQVSVLIALATVVLLALVLVVVSAPLRAARRPLDPESPKPREEAAGGGSLLDRAELETAREAKYREIRDAELDYRTGKLSREDYDAVDRALRAEALEILNRLQAPAEEG